MVLQRIPVAGPWVTDLEVAYVTEAARTSWYDRAGEWVRRFEAAFAQHCGRRYAVSLPSCTAGLHLALLAAGVGPGDEVVVADLTWIASAAPISYVGATPVFADVDLDTWGLSPRTVEVLMTPRTKAVIAVDLYGSMPDLEGLEALCAERSVLLIEDAAEAAGAEIGGRPAGGFGTFSVFSFHGSKTLVTGEGGMLVTDDEALMRRVRVLRDHGRPEGDTAFLNDEVAYKYKMSDLQAAFGLAQLERLDELVGRKRAIFSWYEARLRGCAVTMNPERPNTRSAHWMTSIVLEPTLGLSKQEVRAELDRAAIDSRPFFSPLSSLPAYAGSQAADEAARANRVSYLLGRHGVNLPSALSLTEEQVDRVCASVIGLARR